MLTVQEAFDYIKPPGQTHEQVEAKYNEWFDQTFDQVVASTQAQLYVAQVLHKLSQITDPKQLVSLLLTFMMVSITVGQVMVTPNPDSLFPPTTQPIQ